MRVVTLEVLSRWESTVSFSRQHVIVRASRSAHQTFHRLSKSSCYRSDTRVRLVVLPYLAINNDTIARFLGLCFTFSSLSRITKHKKIENRAGGALEKVLWKRFLVVLCGNILLMTGLSGAIISGFFYTYVTFFRQDSSSQFYYLALAIILAMVAGLGESIEALGKDIMTSQRTQDSPTA